MPKCASLRSGFSPSAVRVRVAYGSGQLVSRLAFRTVLLLVALFAEVDQDRCCCGGSAELQKKGGGGQGREEGPCRYAARA